MAVVLSALKRSFPGLFAPAGCQSQSEAERYADAVAAQAGLTIREGSWISSDGSRRIEYRNRQNTLKLQVECLMEATGRGNTPCWLFSFWGERVDANLTVKSPHAVQVRPSSFQREVKGMIARLRSLRVEEGGRIVGRVKRWNAAQGIGTVECMPGALVLLEANELAMGETVRYNERLSFKVQKTAAKQKAVEVRRDALTGHKSGPQS